VLEETQVRTGVARRVLGDALEPPALAALPHLWLPLSELAAEQVAGRALREGVQVTPPRAMVLDDAPVRGLRLCLGPAMDQAALEKGLSIVRAALAPGGESHDAI
jgi:DNA-binding transcriptional MocR family regulator